MRTKEMSQISSWNREGVAGVSAAAMLSLAAQQCNKELHYYELWLMFSIVVHQHSQKMVASTSIIITGIMPKSKSRGWVFLLLLNRNERAEMNLEQIVEDFTMLKTRMTFTQESTTSNLLKDVSHSPEENINNVALYVCVCSLLCFPHLKVMR